MEVAAIDGTLPHPSPWGKQISSHVRAERPPKKVLEKEEDKEEEVWLLEDSCTGHALT